MLFGTASAACSDGFACGRVVVFPFVQASFDGLPIINQQGSFSQFNVSWPVPAGPITINKSVKIPSLLAGASIIVNVSAADGQGQEIACIGLQIVAVSPSDDEVEPSVLALAAAVVEADSLFARSSADVATESAIAKKDPAALLHGMLDSLWSAVTMPLSPPQVAADPTVLMCFDLSALHASALSSA